MGAGEIMGSGWGLLIILFCFVLAILWIMLPFAVSSIQKSMKQSVELNKSILAELKLLNKSSKNSAEGLTTQDCPSCGYSNDLGNKECIKCAARLVSI